MKGVIVAAPASGSGKTTVTLGLLRALRDLGVAIAPAKAGPDYIDPAYHTVASGVACANLDPWAMRPDLISALASRHIEGGKMLVVEAMMGLFDGAMDGRGSAADLATHLSLPVILVLDCARQSHSIAALVSGFRDFRRNVMIAGLILNRIGSARHDAMLRSALAPVGIPVLGSVPRDEKLQLPERHLGLVQAGVVTPKAARAPTTVVACRQAIFLPAQPRRARRTACRTAAKAGAGGVPSARSRPDWKRSRSVVVLEMEQVEARDARIARRQLHELHVVGRPGRARSSRSTSRDRCRRPPGSPARPPASRSRRCAASARPPPSVERCRRTRSRPPVSLGRG